MGLINCSISDNGAVVIQHDSGVDDIPNVELFISANDGYVVSASDFIDGTLLTYPQQSDDTDYNDIFDSILLEDTTSPGSPDNQVKVIVNFIQGYFISADTILFIDIDGFAVIPSKTVHLALIEDMSNMVVDEGSDLFNTGAGTFDSGTYTWGAYDHHSITNVSNELKITQDTAPPTDGAAAAYLYLRALDPSGTSGDLSSALVQDTNYVLQFEARYTGGSVGPTAKVLYGGATAISCKPFTNEMETYRVYFKAVDVVTPSLQILGMNIDNQVFIDNITIKQSTPTATFTFLDVYSGSVLDSELGSSAGNVQLGDTASNDQLYYFTTEVTPGEQKKIATIKCKVTDNLVDGLRHFLEGPIATNDAGDVGYSKFELLPSLSVTPNVTTVDTWNSSTITQEKIFDLWFTEPLDAGESPNLSAGLYDEAYSLFVFARMGEVLDEVIPDEPTSEVPQVGEIWYASVNPYAIYDGVVTERIQEIEGDDSGGVTGFITLMSDMLDGTPHSWDDWSDAFSIAASFLEWPNYAEAVIINSVRSTLESATGFAAFSDEKYWLSTEHPALPELHARQYNYVTGATNYTTKDFIKKVRAIKTFESPAFRGGVVGARHEVTNARTNLNDFTNNASNIIPSSGITKTNAPRVDIHGVPGSRFSVEFRETAVVESVTGRSLGTGGVDYFDGLLPDMPDGVVAIPASGIYSFKFPEITDWSDSSTVGWKEFEMKIIAASNTTIKSKVVKKGGISTNIGRLGSTVTNKFYQYPNVNIKIQATKNSTWTFDGTSHLGSEAGHVTHLFLGGSGSTKTGKPKESISSSKKYTDAQKVLDFEIIVNKGSSGIFSLNTGYTFDKSSFVVTDEENDCVVTFSSLQADIGRGIADGTNNTDYASVSGTIHFSNFGLQDQVFTLDLDQIFNNA
tara:strand:- start:590 stop:3316 length:2727 start_codon:yes stop_codon:yes gene_type:complete